MLRRLCLWYLLLPCLMACQCTPPASAPLPWQGASCFNRPPPCPSKLICKNGVWNCISCIDGETKVCYEGNRTTIGKGECKQGVSTCSFGTWGICVNQVVPNEKDACGDGKDDNCDGKIDDGCDCAPGGPEQVCGQDIGECKSGRRKCSAKGKWLACQGEIKPTLELCDGKDNDCNGQVDENFKQNAIGKRGLGQPCEEGTGSCRSSGVYVCTADGTNVRCNAPILTPSEERCDGKDNDCNGQVDEKWPNKGKDCDNGRQGVCLLKGTLECKQDGSGLTCSASGGKAQKEICDGKDNNCNGKVDENFPGKGDSCDVGGASGVCQKGQKNCQSGVEVCDQVNQPGQEVCDGKDNNCNGKVDENFPDKGKDCTISNTSSDCEDGTRQCENGKPFCKSKKTPSQETCNDTDDDCNGKVDDNLTRQCSNGCGQQTCKEGNWEGDCTCCNDGDKRSCNLSSASCGSAKEVCNNNTWGACKADCCSSGDTRSCYTGPSGTEGRGICKSGKETCVDGDWGQCQGEVTPANVEKCEDGKDSKCNGDFDERKKSGKCQR